MNIKQVMKLTQLSKRTLHHYDDIGLLRPKRKDDNGYRDYTEDDLLRLEQILLYREMGFALSDIGALLDGQKEDLSVMMKKHKAVILTKKDRLDKILALIEKRIEGEKDMTFEAFNNEDIEKAKTQYAAEAKERWGGTDAYKQSREKTESYDKKDWSRINAEANTIFGAFSAMSTLKPDDEKRLMLAEE